MRSARGSTGPAGGRRPDLPSGRVAAATHRGRGLPVDVLVHAADDLGHPIETFLQDPLDSCLKGAAADRARRARPLELDLDDPGLGVSAYEHQIAPVGLNSGADEIDQLVEVGEALGAFVVRNHVPILPGAGVEAAVIPWPGVSWSCMRPRGWHPGVFSVGRAGREPAAPRPPVWGATKLRHRPVERRSTLSRHRPGRRLLVRRA